MQQYFASYSSKANTDNVWRRVACAFPIHSNVFQLGKCIYKGLFQLIKMLDVLFKIFIHFSSRITKTRVGEGARIEIGRTRMLIHTPSES